MLDGTKVRANASSSGFRRKPTVEEYLEQAREAVEALNAQTEEESSRQMQAAQQRARREKQERLESALKEYAKLKAAKSRIDRVSTTDPDARVMKQAEGGSAPSYNVQVSTDAEHGLKFHLRRRSQRPFRPPKGVTFYRHLATIGLDYL